MLFTGNASYSSIKNKQYINIDADAEKQQKIINELNKQKILFSARFDDKKITITFSQGDFSKVNNAIEFVDRKQQPMPEDVLPFNDYEPVPEDVPPFSDYEPVPEDIPPFNDYEHVPKDVPPFRDFEPTNSTPVNNTMETHLSPTELRKMMLKLSSDPSFMKEFMANQELQARKAEEAERQLSAQDKQEAQQTEQQKPQSITDSKSTEMSFNNSQIDTTKETFKLLPIISTKVANQQQRIDTLNVKRTVAEEKISMQQARINHLTEKAERLTTTNQMLKQLMNNKMTPSFVKSAAEKVIKNNDNKIAKIRNEKIPKRESKIEKQKDKIAKFDRKINLAQCKINRYTSLNNVITSFSLTNNADRRKQFAVAMDNLHNSSINLYNAKIDNATAKIVDLTAKYKESNNIMFKSAAMETITRQKINRQKCINKRNKLMGIIIPMTSQPENVQDEALKQTENVVNNELQKDNITAAEVADNIAAAPLPALPEKSLAQPDPTKDIELLIPEIANVMDMSVSELDSKPMDIKQMLVLDYTNNFESTPEEIQESLSSIITPNQSVEQNINNAKSARQAEANQTTDVTVMQGQNVSSQVVNQTKEAADKTAEKDKNYLKSAEMAVEGNYDMIDGIINNTPPPKEPEKEQVDAAPATISMSLLFGNVDVANEIYAEQQKDNSKKEKNPVSID